MQPAVAVVLLVAVSALDRWTVCAVPEAGAEVLLVAASVFDRWPVVAMQMTGVIVLLVAVSALDRWPVFAVPKAAAIVLLASVAVFDRWPVVSVELVVDEVATQRLGVVVRASDLADGVSEPPVPERAAGLCWHDQRQQWWPASVMSRKHTTSKIMSRGKHGGKTRSSRNAQVCLLVPASLCEWDKAVGPWFDHADELWGPLRVDDWETTAVYLGGVVGPDGRDYAKVFVASSCAHRLHRPGGDRLGPLQLVPRGRMFVSRWGGVRAAPGCCVWGGSGRCAYGGGGGGALFGLVVVGLAVGERDERR